MSTKTKRISYKNKSQIEKEVKSAQKKLLQIFLGDLEVTRDQSTNSADDSQPSKNPKLEAYNKFNDESFNISPSELLKLTAKDVEIEKKKSKPARTIQDDPVIKYELSKYNYTDLVELNRDFAFYSNHPEKLRKLNKVLIKKYGKKKPTSTDHEEMTETGFNMDKDQTDFGLLTHSRDIIRNIERSRAHGFMSQKERKRLIKNLF